MTFERLIWDLFFRHLELVCIRLFSLSIFLVEKGFPSIYGVGWALNNTNCHPCFFFFSVSG